MVPETTLYVIVRLFIAMFINLIIKCVLPVRMQSYQAHLVQKRGKSRLCLVSLKKMYPYEQVNYNLRTKMSCIGNCQTYILY